MTVSVETSASRERGLPTPSSRSWIHIFFMIQSHVTSYTKKTFLFIFCLFLDDDLYFISALTFKIILMDIHTFFTCILYKTHVFLAKNCRINDIHERNGRQRKIIYITISSSLIDNIKICWRYNFQPFMGINYSYTRLSYMYYSYYYDQATTSNLAILN